MADQEEKLKVVDSYGKGDPGKLGFIPMMAMVAVQTRGTKKSEGGIVIPDNSPAASDYRTPEGTVLAVGPEVKYLKVGDRVLFPAQAMGYKIFYQRCNFIVIKEDQAFGTDINMSTSEYVKEGRTSGNT